MTVYGSPREPEPPGDDDPAPPAVPEPPDPRPTGPAAAEPAAVAGAAESAAVEPASASSLGRSWQRQLRGPRVRPLAGGLVLVALAVAAGFTAAAGSGSPDAAAAVWREAPAPVVTTPAPPDPVTLSAVGDMIVGSYNFGFPPREGAGFFDPVKDALAADVVMGNVEQALTDQTGYSKCGPNSASCYAYAAPPSYAGVFRDAGFTLANVNNNHTNDYGPQGQAGTRTALTGAGITVTGGVDEIAHVTVKDVDVAAIGFAPYTWGANLNDIPRAAELVRQAAASADLVVVQFHGGAEGASHNHVLPAGQSEYAFGENRGDLRTFAHAVIAAGADLVVGHGPHVLRGIEFYQGRLIAYSLGNFAGYRALNAAGYSGVGAILKVALNPDGSWAGGSLTATELVSPGTPGLDPDLRALPFVDGLSVADFGAAGVRVDHATGRLTVPS